LTALFNPLSSGSNTSVLGDIVVETLGPNTDWQTTLAGVDAVVHLAARVHCTSDKEALQLYRDVNDAPSGRRGPSRFVIDTTSALDEVGDAGRVATHLSKAVAGEGVRAHGRHKQPRLMVVEFADERKADAIQDLKFQGMLDLSIEAIASQKDLGSLASA
jgi:hypothetical protein